MPGGIAPSNWRLVQGTLTLRHAKKGEPFIGINGKTEEHAAAGEVVYADSQGITCRYWNDRDSDRTKITKKTTRFLIFFDGINDETAIAAAQSEMTSALTGVTTLSSIVK